MGPGLEVIGEEGQEVIQVAECFANAIGRGSAGDGLSIEAFCFSFSGSQIVKGQVECVAPVLGVFFIPLSSMLDGNGKVGPHSICLAQRVVC
jgi:hypothetical protein